MGSLRSFEHAPDLVLLLGRFRVKGLCRTWSLWFFKYGPLKGDPYIPLLYPTYTTQGPILQNPFREVSDHVKDPHITILRKLLGS